MTGLSDMRRIVERRKGARDSAIAKMQKVRGKIDRFSADLQESEQARVVIQQVAAETQSALEYYVSELATLAMQSVLPEPYDLKVKFDSRWERTEAQITLERDEEEIDPMTASGGGVVDLVAFGLRMSLWTLRRPRTAPVFILDEPFRSVSRDLQDRVSALLKEISQRLGVQMIIVSHEESLIEQADRVFYVSMGSDGRSVVKGEGVVQNFVRKAKRRVRCDQKS